MNPNTDMTDDEIRQAVAESLGWKRIHYKTAKSDTWLAPGEAPRWEMDAITGICPRPRDNADKPSLDGLGMPRFDSSLDAMALAEATLTYEECPDYHEKLCEIHASESCERDTDEPECPADDFWFHATARQRALAFLTVKGASRAS